MKLSSLRCLLLALLATQASAVWSEEQTIEVKSDAADEQQAKQPVEYGVDVSFPMHYAKVSTNYAWLPHNLDPSRPVPPQYKDMPVQPLGDKQSWYDDFLDGCIKHYGKKGHRCKSTEDDRIAMSLRQPQSMQNYTELGYKKIKAPVKLFSIIKEFWDRNKDKGGVERWGQGNTYTNNWEAPTEMISVEDSKLRGGGYGLKQRIWDAAKEIISEWTGEELTQCSLYGIRVYKENAILATHVDRLPLVSSAIINVAQDLDEPWPLEVIGHDGKAKNVTMEAGDMVLYESHSVLHGRPFPLKGRFMANLFVHFEPTGHSLRHNAKIDDANKHVDKKYREALERGQGGHEHDFDGLPSYILPGTEEAKKWKRSHPDPAKKDKIKSFTTGSTPAHGLAQKGATHQLEEYLKEHKNDVNARDKNGWTPLMESARGGHLDAVKLLIANGADVDIKTYGTGGTALWWAKQTHDEDHPVIEFLESIGALDAGPEL